MDSNENINQIIYKEYFDRIDEIKKGKIRFSHYTSARVALSIIENKTIWLNNVQYMNDYTEVKLGNFLLTDFYNQDTGKELRSVLEDISSGCRQDVEPNYNRILSKLRNTYAFCLTEHIEDEDKLGRLSMWRAYAPKNGVAIVFNSDVFLEAVCNTKAMTIPMFYFDKREFAAAVNEFTDRINREKEKLKNSVDFKEQILDKFLITALSLKHKGFREEREWRILYNDAVSQSLYPEIVKESIELINGVPRIIKKLKFSEICFKNRIFNMNELINKIIIGPDANPEQLKEIFIKTLTKNGVSDADKKVECSNIPIRI